MKTTHIIMIYLIFIALITSSFAQDNTQMGVPDVVIARLGKGGINVMQFSPDGKRLANYICQIKVVELFVSTT